VIAGVAETEEARRFIGAAGSDAAGLPKRRLGS
jgi:hypothetical protein